MRQPRVLAMIGLLASLMLRAETTARGVVERSIANHEEDWKAVLGYTYTETDASTESSEKDDVYQVSVADGTPYSRLIARDGHPLDPEEASRQAEKYQKMLETRLQESPAQRNHRIRKYDEEDDFLKQIPDAFSMKMLGNEMVNGRLNYVILLTPRAGYVPQGKYARIFPNIEGKLWVDQQDMRWTKAEAHVIGTISFGWIMARIGPGAHISLTQEKVDDHWFPKRIEVEGMAKILLVKNRPICETISYRNYERVRR